MARLSETLADQADLLREQVLGDLRADLGDAIVDSHLVPNDDLWVRVATNAWFEVAQSLKARGFEYFCFLSGIDWLPSPYGKSEDDPTAEKSEDDEVAAPKEITWGYTGGETRFQLLARLTDLRRHVSVTLKVDVPEPLSMPTWVGVYSGANWHERETHEMFGITFVGHPDLRNLYLPGEFEGFPLRKDFPLLSRMVKPWPGIVDVEPMPAGSGAASDEEVDAV